MALPAHAQQACAPRDVILGTLGGKYSEAPVALGLTSTGALIELLTTEDGSTWTLVLSMPDGRTCMMASGTDWQGREFVAPTVDDAT